MARYEQARFEYRKAVLASLDGVSNGQAIQQAIRAFQSASAELKRLERCLPRPESKRDVEAVASRESSFLHRLLSAALPQPTRAWPSSMARPARATPFSPR
jgi:hypothetical protein